MTVRSYGPEFGYWYVLFVTLIYADMILDHGHGILSVHGQLLCKILSRPNLAVRKYVFTVTFTLEIFKIMANA